MTTASRSRLRPSQAAFVEIPDAHVRPAETPVDINRCRAGAGGETPMLSALMMEPTDAQAVRGLVTPVARTIDEMVGIEVSTRRAPRSHTPPPIAFVDVVAVPARRVSGIPGADEVLEHRQQPDPGRNAAAALEKAARRGHGWRRLRVRPGFIPADTRHDPGERAPVALDGRGEIGREPVGERQPQENIRAGQGPAARRDPLRRDATISQDPLAGRARGAPERRVPFGIVEGPRGREAFPVPAPTPERACFVPQALDGRFPGTRDPRLLEVVTHRAVTDLAQDQEHGVEPEPARLVGRS